MLKATNTPSRFEKQVVKAKNEVVMSTSVKNFKVGDFVTITNALSSQPKAGKIESIGGIYITVEGEDGSKVKRMAENLELFKGNVDSVSQSDNVVIQRKHVDDSAKLPQKEVLVDSFGDATDVKAMVLCYRENLHIRQTRSLWHFIKFYHGAAFDLPEDTQATWLFYTKCVNAGIETVGHMVNNLKKLVTKVEKDNDYSGYNYEFLEEYGNAWIAVDVETEAARPKRHKQTSCMSARSPRLYMTAPLPHIMTIKNWFAKKFSVEEQNVDDDVARKMYIRCQDLIKLGYDDTDDSI